MVLKGSHFSYRRKDTRQSRGALTWSDKTPLLEMLFGRWRNNVCNSMGNQLGLNKLCMFVSEVSVKDKEWEPERRAI
ncbi:hypothetical protein CEXT_167111 [Caerostris extrusa]|uniref:Uncharacterized protein n=1 Tax=Caerostris extrusa TaxID=172846 RepID=A0AAV4XA60_CAEEX|nr:hypothetical protein CEXT_167111 [Caerostris extrusa]